jgi:hypothetical protein
MISVAAVSMAFITTHNLISLVYVKLNNALKIMFRISINVKQLSYIILSKVYLKLGSVHFLLLQTRCQKSFSILSA